MDKVSRESLYHIRWLRRVLGLRKADTCKYRCLRLSEKLREFDCNH